MDISIYQCSNKITSEKVFYTHTAKCLVRYRPVFGVLVSLLQSVPRCVSAPSSLYRISHAETSYAGHFSSSDIFRGPLTGENESRVSMQKQSSKTPPCQGGRSKALFTTATRAENTQATPLTCTRWRQKQHHYKSKKSSS